MKPTKWAVGSGFAAVLLSGTTVLVQGIAREELADALREGGYVIVMREASSPREPPDVATGNADKVNRERQLNETGRADAAAMGEAMRSRGIPIAEVLSSPTYRAVETARRLGNSVFKYAVRCPIDKFGTS